MKPRFQAFLLFTLLVLAVTGVVSAKTPSALTSGLNLISPTACPTSGCAAGQRLNFEFQYNLGAYDTVNNPNSPNVVVCLYTPSGWADASPSGTTQGISSNITYTWSSGTPTGCGAAPTGTVFLGQASANLPAGHAGDSVMFPLRISPNTISPGTIYALIYDLEKAAWVQITTSNNHIPLSVVTLTSPAYVANDATACGASSPCFLNSGDDLADGLGTGLKDAVDALAHLAHPEIRLLGAYTIKSNPVAVTNPVVIDGQNGASLTYTGSQCTNPMLDLRVDVTIQNLSINSGICPTPRDLVAVDTVSPVTLAYNDLTVGNDAVHVNGNASDVTLQFNKISGNSGYAVWIGSDTAALNAVANNISGNHAGSANQVECNAGSAAANTHAVLDGNFWGDGVLPQGTAAHCTVTDALRLGAAIQPRSPGPGVDAQKVTVTGTKAAAFNNQVSYSQTGSTGVDLIIANHAVSSPFQGAAQPAFTPCSSYWDVFLPGGSSFLNSSKLNLFFTYNLNAACTAAVESTTYCAAASPHVPLWWYDLTASQWKLTGEASPTQPTTCDLANHELQVSIGGTGSTPLPLGASFIPIVVGLDVALPTATRSPSPTPDPSATLTPTKTYTPTPTGSATITPTGSVTVTPTITNTPTASRTPTRTATYYYYYYTPYQSPTPYIYRTNTPTPYTYSSGTPSGSGYPAPSQGISVTPETTPQPTGAAGYPAPEAAAAGGTASASGAAGGYPGPEVIPGQPGLNSSILPAAAGGPALAATETTAAGETALPGSPLPASTPGTWRNIGLGGLLAALGISGLGWRLFLLRGLR